MSANSTRSLSPKEITEKVEEVGVGKANMPMHQVMLLGMLAGAYIGIGALFYTLIKSDHHLSFAVASTMAGLAFSTGLILVCVSGAELFTGNTLMLLAWSKKRICLTAVAKNWAFIFLANSLGAIILALLVHYSGHANMNHGEIAKTYVKVANAKAQISISQAFFRGIMCNILVCLGVWMAYAGQTIVDKVMGIIFPVAAFVAAGFEHSVANMYVFAMGFLEKATAHYPAESLTLTGAIHNILPVFLGNIVGGGIFIGLVYSAIFRKK